MMSLELEIHPVQTQILRTLLFWPETRFSKLNTSKMPTDHFTFHLKRLVEVGLVEKTKQNTYRLTSQGKEFANRFDTEKVALERQAKIGVLVGGVREKDGQCEYLIQQRLKQPYYGFYGFITGKVGWGESILETATRELEEETGLTGKNTLVGIEHKTDFSKEGQLLEDKYFFIVRADNPKGKLKKDFEGGKNHWLTKDKIFKLPNLFPDMKLVLKILDQDEFVFEEKRYTVLSY
jgi:8-oxo-dGTP pyrophosphatase MutT (NUDIX family)